MALMLRPEPMPVDVMAAVLVVGVELVLVEDDPTPDMLELM
jgi:hypothetical protein